MPDKFIVPERVTREAYIDLLEQFDAMREALIAFAFAQEYDANGNEYFVHGKRTREMAESVLASVGAYPASSPDDCPNCDGKGHNTGWPHTTCPVCDGTGKEPDPAFVRCDDCAWDLCDQAKVCRKTTYPASEPRVELEFLPGALPPGDPAYKASNQESRP